MDAIDRVIGRLEAHYKDLHERLVTIERKIDSLQNFRWKLAGGAAIVSFLISATVAAIVETYRN